MGTAAAAQTARICLTEYCGSAARRDDLAGVGRATAGDAAIEVVACMGCSSLRRKGVVCNGLHTAGRTAALPARLPASFPPRAGAATGGWPYPCAASRTRL